MAKKKRDKGPIQSAVEAVEEAGFPREILTFSQDAPTSIEEKRAEILNRTSQIISQGAHPPEALSLEQARSSVGNLAFLWRHQSVLSSRSLPPVDVIKRRPLEWETVSVYRLVKHEGDDQTYRHCVASAEQAVELLSKNALPQNERAVVATHTKIVEADKPGRDRAFELPCVEILSITEEESRGESTKTVSSGLYVPASDTRAYLWKKYGLNLSALAGYQNATEGDRNTAPEPLITPKSVEEALSYFGPQLEHTVTVDGEAYGPKRYAPTGGDTPFEDMTGLKRPVNITLKSYTGKTQATINTRNLVDYYALNDLAILIGHIHKQLFPFLKGVDVSRLGPNKPALPLCEISFSEPGAKEGETAEVAYFERDEILPINDTALPLRGLKGTAETALHTVFRLRAEIQKDTYAIYDASEGREKALHALQLYDHQSSPELQERTGPPPEELRELATKIDKLNANNQRRASELRKAYLSLCAVVEKRREENLALMRERASVQGRIEVADQQLGEVELAKMPANLKDLLPHMSTVPAGVGPLLHRYNNSEALTEAMGRIGRSLATGNDPVQLELGFPKDETAIDDIFRAAQYFFGERSWILPIGYVGLCKMAQENQGYDSDNYTRTYASDFWATIRPDKASSIRGKRGIHGIAGKDIDATELYRCFMTVLNVLRYPYTDPKSNEQRRLWGLVDVAQDGRDSRGRYFVDWKFNDYQKQLITGGLSVDGPMFMVVDSEAMFSYRAKQLSLAPALQLYMEWLIRCNVNKGLYDKNNGTLLTPQGYGFTIGTIADSVGVAPSSSRGYSKGHVIKRVYQALDTLAEKGPIESWKRQGQERRNPFETKVELHVSKVYGAAYERARDLHQLREIDSNLSEPFTPTKRNPKRKARRKRGVARKS